MKPWLDVCRNAVGDIKVVLAELPTRVEREEVAISATPGRTTLHARPWVERRSAV